MAERHAAWHTASIPVILRPAFARQFLVVVFAAGFWLLTRAQGAGRGQGVILFDVLVGAGVVPWSGCSPGPSDMYVYIAAVSSAWSAAVSYTTAAMRMHRDVCISIQMHALLSGCLHMGLGHVCTARLWVALGYLQCDCQGLWGVHCPGRFHATASPAGCVVKAAMVCHWRTALRV